MTSASRGIQEKSDGKVRCLGPEYLNGLMAPRFHLVLKAVL